MGGVPFAIMLFACSIFLSVMYFFGGIFNCSVNNAFRYPSETVNAAESSLTVLKLNNQGDWTSGEGSAYGQSLCCCV